jgi:hypothetical protein
MEMSRNTSIEAYKHIVTSGILGVRRTQVYEVVYHDGPIGSREVWESIKKTQSGIPQHSINPRFKELLKMGIVERVGEHQCPFTKRKVTSWDVTSLLPTEKYKPDLTKGELLRESLHRLMAKHGDKKVPCDKVINIVLGRMDKFGL